MTPLRQGGAPLETLCRQFDESSSYASFRLIVFRRHIDHEVIMMAIQISVLLYLVHSIESDLCSHTAYRPIARGLVVIASFVVLLIWVNPCMTM